MTLKDRTALTPREREVVALIAAGDDTATIAAALSVSTSTVKNHTYSIFAKLHVNSRVAAVAAAAARGYVSVPPRPNTIADRIAVVLAECDELERELAGATVYDVREYLDRISIVRERARWVRSELEAM